MLDDLIEGGIDKDDIKNYIEFFALRTNEIIKNKEEQKLHTEQIYIHSKVIIVDDDIVIMGSANINDRSMLGFKDSEIAIRIEDETKVKSIMNGQEVEVSKFAS